MADTTQTIENHVRYHAPFHFFTVPLFLIYLIYSLVQLIRFPDADHGVSFGLSVGLTVMVFLPRLNALRVQDRLIRLEERLRYQQLLSATMAEQASALPVAQIVALRFASDEELPSLVQQVLDGKLTRSLDIKRAVKSWRPDTLRV